VTPVELYKGEQLREFEESSTLAEAELEGAERAWRRGARRRG
jgi:hypothetical protein